ncbi:MAG: SCO family protein [Gammaproteobacteria bacterium]|jgi:protein SCO1|nr:SCO family protein [Gammaproteobacteria bacterium]
MNKTYLIYGLALIILSMIYLGDGQEEKPNFTRINADHLFLEENKTYRTTINDSFNNDSLKNHITLVFFGYASCPDFCPDTLAKMNKLFKTVSENNQNKKLQLLFISIDPKDEMEVMKKYVEYFNKDFIGMPMNGNNLDKVIKKAGVYVKKVSSEGDIDFYDHTGAIFIVNSDAKVIGIYTPPILNDLILEDIVKVLD